MRADIVLLSLLHADAERALEFAKTAIAPLVFELPPQPTAVDPSGEHAPELIHDNMTGWPDFALAAASGLRDRGYRTVEMEFPPSEPGDEYRIRRNGFAARRPLRVKHWPQLEALADACARMKRAVVMLQRGEGEIPANVWTPD